MKRMDAAAALRACPLFHGFTDTGIAILAGVCAKKTFPVGTPLFVEQMMSDSMFVIAEGRVALAVKNGVQNVPVGELADGDWLGELALIAQGQRQCTATAATVVEAFELRQADFQKLMGTKPQACIKLLMSICTHFGEKVVANKDALKSLAVK